MMNSAAVETCSTVSLARSASVIDSSGPSPAPSTTSVRGRTNDSMIGSPFEPDRLLREHDVRSHQPRLLAGSLHQNAPVDPVGESGIVPDQWAGAGLAARDPLFEQHRLEPLRCGVDGCCE